MNSTSESNGWNLFLKGMNIIATHQRGWRYQTRFAANAWPTMFCQCKLLNAVRERHFLIRISYLSFWCLCDIAVPLVISCWDDHSSFTEVLLDVALAAKILHDFAFPPWMFYAGVPVPSATCGEFLEAAGLFRSVAWQQVSGNRRKLQGFFFFFHASYDAWNLRACSFFSSGSQFEATNWSPSSSLSQSARSLCYSCSRTF